MSWFVVASSLQMVLHVFTILRIATSRYSQFSCPYGVLLRVSILPIWMSEVGLYLHDEELFCDAYMFQITYYPNITFLYVLMSICNEMVIIKVHTSSYADKYILMSRRQRAID